MAQSSSAEPIDAVALLGDPNRRRLYELVVASSTPVGRTEAAEALGMSRELAAFHLDRMVEAGLLDTEYRRRSGRTGPGAGRPAKLYRRSAREIAVSLPPRRYERAAQVFADAFTGEDGPSSADAISEVAYAQGRELGIAARREARPRPGHGRLRATLLDLLQQEGYEPGAGPETGSVTLRNCPFRSLATSHRELTCGMNLAWARGVVDGLRIRGLRLELEPAPGRCCVVVRQISPRSAPGTGR